MQNLNKHKENRLLSLIRLSKLIESTPGFSFLRLGDGELRFLLHMQSGIWDDARYDYSRVTSSVEKAISGAALKSEHYERLQAAYDYCSFLDLNFDIDYIKKHYSSWRRKQSPSQFNATTSDEGGSLLLDWTHVEFPRYISGKTTLFCGAEASLQRELLGDKRYRSIARSFWPEDADVHFVQPVHDGRFLARDLEEIKEQLRSAIRRVRPHTVFLCLGGYAKILAYELAVEEGVRTFDFGSMLRALTYSGSSGYATWRANHNPFFFRVPLDVYLDALLKVKPDITISELTAKAHAQLSLDLQRKEYGKTYPADLHDPSSFSPTKENLDAFWADYRIYRSRVRKKAKNDNDAKTLLDEFDYWLLKKGIGFKGKLFRMAVSAKGMLRRWSLIT